MTKLVVKTFSATMHQERNELGDLVTSWLRRSRVRVQDIRVNQSSDESHHCLTITVIGEEA